MVFGSGAGAVEAAGATVRAADAAEAAEAAGVAGIAKAGVIGAAGAAGAGSRPVSRLILIFAHYLFDPGRFLICLLF